MKSSNKDRRVTEAGKDYCVRRISFKSNNQVKGGTGWYLHTPETFHTDEALHREAGPAFIYKNGLTEYWLNNIKISKEEWLKDPAVRAIQLKKKIDKVLEGE